MAGLHLAEFLALSSSHKQRTGNGRLARFGPISTAVAETSRRNFMGRCDGVWRHDLYNLNSHTGAKLLADLSRLSNWEPIILLLLCANNCGARPKCRGRTSC